MINQSDITLRKLTLADLPLMHQWLNQPHVHEWYDKDKQNTLEEITDRYGPKINHEQPTDCYLVLYQGRPVAYIQSYLVNDWPEFGDHLGYDDHTAAVDLFIGDKDYMGQGLGNIMLTKFLESVLFKNSQITSCIIGPEPNNVRAIKSYQKAGFVYAKTLQIPGESEPTYIMEFQKKNLFYDN